MDGTLFTLHVHPYFLRLTFSHRLLEDDDPVSSYDPSSSFLVVRLAKAQHGITFEDLDLLSKLLAPPTILQRDAPDKDPSTSLNMSGLSLDSGASVRKKGHPLIEVLSSTEEVTSATEKSGDNAAEHLRKEREVFLEGILIDSSRSRFLT